MAFKITPLIFCLVFVAGLNLVLSKPDGLIMKTISVGFGKALDECREESNLTPEIMEEFLHFWRDDFEIKHRELGCAILCMNKKFDLLQDNQRMHHGNMDDFIKSFHQGEKLARRIIEIIHECEKEFDAMEDHCDRIMHVAKCFKSNAIKEGIAPTMEMLVIAV
nr:odorant binding protein [Endoclita signifer]